MVMSLVHVIVRRPEHWQWCAIDLRKEGLVIGVCRCLRAAAGEADP